MPAANAATRSNEIGRSSAGAKLRFFAPTKTIAQLAKPTIASILIIISTLWTVLPAFTPRQLMIVSAAKANAPAKLSATGKCVISKK
jgi:hypothetical protein